MTTISRFALVALLSISAASIVLPNLAAAAATTPPPPCNPLTGCGGPPPGPGNPDTPPPSDDPFDWEDFGKNDPGEDQDDDGEDDGTDDEDKGGDGSGTGKGKDGKDSAGVKTPVQQLNLDCSIRDEVPTTSDMWLVNVGNAALPAGTKVQYRIPATGDHGAFMLQQEIPAGKSKKLPNLISVAVQVGTECAVQIIS